MQLKSAEKSPRDFCYNITNYFDEWVNGLESTDFVSLRDFITTDQIKKRVPNEVTDHLLDNWVEFVSQ